jgi:hypothetical protein
MTASLDVGHLGSMLAAARRSWRAPAPGIVADAGYAVV